MTISHWITEASHQLASKGIPSPALDAEILLGLALRHPRPWLIAHGEEIIEERTASQAKKLLQRRLNHEPVAYIIGYKEFYGREFIVTPDVLIPRPETEMMIDILKELYQAERPRDRETERKLIDVGCGSGCLGITVKREMPDLEVTLCDISEPALNIASQNSIRLHTKIQFTKSDILAEFLSPDLSISRSLIWAIVANLPYVDATWQRSPETNYEPAAALFANDGGLGLIKKCIQQSQRCLAKNGYLLLEADPCQHREIISYAQLSGLHHYLTKDYIIVLVNKD